MCEETSADKCQENAETPENTSSACMGQPGSCSNPCDAQCGKEAPDTSATPLPWYKRVEIERDELIAKIEKLTNFIHGRIDNTRPPLDPMMENLLILQHNAMVTYLGVLQTRLSTIVPVVNSEAPVMESEQPVQTDQTDNSSADGE